MTVIGLLAPNGALKRRPLEIPGPTSREPAVRDALAALILARADQPELAQKAIDDFGLTIEVARLRDRLVGLPPTDLRRLLLATPGVPEALFLRAIKEQLKDQQARDDTVSDTSVEELGDVIKKSFSDMSIALSAALDAIAKANRDQGTSKVPGGAYGDTATGGGGGATVTDEALPARSPREKTRKASDQ